MKNSTTFTVIVSFFAVMIALALGLTNPELFSGSSVSVVGHGVNESVSTLTSIVCMTVPFVALGIVLITSYVWHKETSLNKSKKFA